MFLPNCNIGGEQGFSVQVSGVFMLYVHFYGALYTLNGLVGLNIKVSIKYYYH